MGVGGQIGHMGKEGQTGHMGVDGQTDHMVGGGELAIWSMLMIASMMMEAGNIGASQGPAALEAHSTLAQTLIGSLRGAHHPSAGQELQAHLAIRAGLGAGGGLNQGGGRA